MPALLQPWRRRTHAALLALFAGIPFIPVGGEGAVRFDVPTLRLHLFGAVVRMDEFFTVLLALLSLAFLFIWLTVAWGRIWCGWLCPQTVLVDLTGTNGKGGRRRPVRQLRILALSVLGGAVSVWYFVPPWEFLRDLATGSLGTVALWAWAVTSLLIWLDLQLVRYTFCATVCPYARLQGVMFDRHTLAIAFDESRRGECIDCTACLKACPVGIDIRQGLQAACVNCTACIDTCARVMGRKKKGSLVGYFFGGPGGASRPLRPAASLPLAAGLVFFALFLLSLSGRSGLEASLRPLPDVPPRRSAEGRIVNSFELSVENRRPEERTFVVTAAGPAGEVRVAPPALRLAPEEHRRVPLTLSAPAAGPVTVLLASPGGPSRRLPATVLEPE